MGEIDEVFILPLEDRPKPTITDRIPLIDLSQTLYSPNYPDELVGEIGNALETWGFFQVINHGVSLEKLSRVDNAVRKFFAQSREEKMKVKRDEMKATGFFDLERTKNVRNWKEVLDFLAHEPSVFPASPDSDDVEPWTSRWPDYPPDLREACKEYIEEVEKLAHKLIELISLSLGLPAKRLLGFFKDEQTSFLRFNFYPPCPSPHLAFGVGGHKDGGALTILAQDDVGGLEVKRKADGEWVSVKPIPDSYIINAGDLIQVWSNDKYESVEHRVTLNSSKERLSIPFFFNPAHSTIVEPLEELRDGKNPPKFRPYNWGKFLIKRRLSTFKNFEDEIFQTSQVKISP